MLKKVKVIFVTMVALSVLAGCSCSSSKEASGLNTSGSAQETTTASVDNETKSENKTDSNVEETAIETDTNSENISESIEDIETTKETEETEVTKESQKTEESQTTKKQQASKEIQTTKKQQSTKETQTTIKQQTTKETQTTKKQQTTKVPETTKEQETTTKKNDTPAVKESGVIYDTLTIQYVKGAYTIPNTYEELLRDYEEKVGETYSLDQITPMGGFTMAGYAGFYTNSDILLEESKWDEDTVKANLFGNELRLSVGENVNAINTIIELYGEPMFSTDYNDNEGYDALVYKYKTNKKNNDYEIFIVFFVIDKELNAMFCVILTEEVAVNLTAQ